MREDHMLKKIQQSFKAIFELESQIVIRHQETLTALSAVENLCEQLQSIQKVKLQDTPLAQFPDLQCNLNNKICGAIQLKIQALQEFW